MAEFVEIDLESSIHELEKLVVLNLFEPSEVKKLAQQRRDNSYNLQKRTKDINDYLRYIRFEEELLQKIREKRTKTGIKKRRTEVDLQIAQRLQTFFRNTVERYKADLELWTEYFRFCERYRFFRTGSKMLQRLMQVHGDKAHLWAFASQWTLKVKKKKEKPNYEMGRNWLIKGIERHPKSKELYTALIKFDLEIARRASSGKTQTDAQMEEMKVALACAEVSYKNAVKNIQDAEFVADALQLFSRYPNTEKLRQVAVSDLEGEFPESEDGWCSRALWAYTHAMPSDPIQDPIQLKQYRREKCLEILQEAVDRVPTEAMWTKYIEFLETQSNKGPDGDPRMRTVLYKSALPGVIAKGLGTVEHFTQLAEFYLSESENPTLAVETIKTGLEKFPTCPALWYELLRIHLTVEDEEKAMQEFSQATEKLKNVPASETFRLWTMMIGYLMKEENKEQTIEEIFQRGLRYRIDLAQLLKPRYVQFRMMAYGIEKARELMQMPHVVNPSCLQFYEKMAEIESKQPQPDIARVRHCYETMLRIFGKDNADLWLDFIRFEKEHGDISQVAKLYQRGLRELTGQQADALVTKYSLQF